MYAAFALMNTDLKEKKKFAVEHKKQFHRITSCNTQHKILFQFWLEDKRCAGWHKQINVRIGSHQTSGSWTELRNYTLLQFFKCGSRECDLRWIEIPYRDWSIQSAEDADYRIIKQVLLVCSRFTLFYIIILLLSNCVWL